MLNRLMSRELPPVPEIGMGATRLCHSDRLAGTIADVVVLGGIVRAVYFQRDKVKRTDDKGMTDSGQAYDYQRDPEADRVLYTLRKDGTYVRQGDKMKNGERLMIGKRAEYYDFSF